MIISSINEDTKVDEIRGLSPTISIDQKTTSNNPRSTVGTITEIYDFYRLLYTTIGTQTCPNHPEISLKKQSKAFVATFVKDMKEGEKIHILSPIASSRLHDIESIKKYVLDSGFVRFQIGDDVYSVADDLSDVKVTKNTQPFIIVDRLVVKKDDENFSKRLGDSIELAYKTGQGILEVYTIDSKTRTLFSEKAACPICGAVQEDLSISNFSFNSHYGACESCHGLGTKVAFLEEKIINPRLSLAEGAILPWTNHIYYMEILAAACKQHKIRMDVPYQDLPQRARDIILHGCSEMFEVSHTFDGASEAKMYKTRYE